MDSKARYLILIILLTINLAGFGQKVPKSLEARVQDEVLTTIQSLSRHMSNIYTATGETTFKFDSTEVKKSRSLFYKYNDKGLMCVSPNILDPAKDFGKSAFYTDTNFLPQNYLVPVNEFMDTLVSWYCNDSCITTLEMNIYNPIFDWDNYYYDPQLLCLKVYTKFSLYGEPYVPRLNDMLTGTSDEQEIHDELDQYFDDVVELYGMLQTSGTMIFLFTLDNNTIKSSYIYKVYDDIIDNSIFVNDVRKITSERNKYYLSVKPFLGKSVLKADFSDINNFQQIDEFQPYYGIQLAFNYYFNDGPRRFTKGLGFGVGISGFKATGQVTDYNTSFEDYSEDFELDYIKYVDADNIKEDLDLTYMDLDFLFKIRYSLFKNVELIGSVGPKLSFLVNSNIEPSTGADGYVTYEGYFDNIEFPDGSTGEFHIQDVPEYGFTTYTDLSFNESEIGINKFNFSAYADLGLNFKMSHKFHFSFGVGYMYGFGNLVSDSNEEDFILSKGDGEVDNMFKNCTSLRISAPSVFISLSYLLNTKIK